MASAPASAERFVIENHDHHFSVSYSDTWHKMTNQKPDEELHIVAPGEGHHASCRIRVREDKRWGLYPRHKFATSLQRVAYSADFWEAYLGEYDHAKILTLDETTGLGPAHGSYVEAIFNETTGPRVQKKGIAAVGYLNDRAYIYECSAATEHYDYFHPMFLNILSKVNIREIGTPKVNGHYRNFAPGRTLQINGLRKIDAYYY